MPHIMPHVLHTSFITKNKEKKNKTLHNHIKQLLVLFLLRQSTCNKIQWKNKKNVCVARILVFFIWNENNTNNNLQVTGVFWFDYKISFSSKLCLPACLYACSWSSKIFQVLVYASFWSRKHKQIKTEKKNWIQEATDEKKIKYDHHEQN